MIKIFIVATTLLSFSYKVTANTSKASSPHISIEDIKLDRTAKPYKTAPFPHADFAFVWDEKDNKTKKYRPQGISQVSDEMVAVSWYGRKEGNNARVGARISFLHLPTLKYTHILLVDERVQTFANIHAGGLFIKDRHLYIPDSRTSTYKIHVFPLDKVEEVPSSNFMGFKYLIRRSQSYKVPIKPSFLSFDHTKNKYMTGTFDLRNRDNLYWFEEGGKKLQTIGPLFKKMQGAATHGDKLLISTSYGRRNRSFLYYGKLDSNGNFDINKFKSFSYPAGLEDLDITKKGKVWTHTEFGPHEAGNDRVVFSAPLSVFK